MDFKYYLKQGIGLMTLNRDIVEEMSKDKNAFAPAVLFFAIGGLAAPGAMFTWGGITGIIIGTVSGPVFSVIFSFIGVGILYLLAKLFGGAGQFKGYYSALGIGSLPIWAAIIPPYYTILGLYISFCSIPIAVVVTNRVHKLSTGKARIVWIFVAVLYYFYLRFFYRFFFDMSHALWQ